MDLNLTLDMIYDLPTKVINISEQNEEFVGMISESVCKQYDMNEIKYKLSHMFSKFNGVKFYYNVPLSESIKTTTSYGLREGSSQRTTISKEESAVTRKIDSMIWASEFYDCIISLSKGLTRSEAIYLSYGLIARKSNEYIAEVLHICPKTVQPIKKSCMIKTWVALETLYEEDI